MIVFGKMQVELHAVNTFTAVHIIQPSSVEDFWSNMEALFCLQHVAALLIYPFFVMD
jgi:hypothetical protein